MYDIRVRLRSSASQKIAVLRLKKVWKTDFQYE